MDISLALRYSGRMSLRQYRIFLIWYGVVFLPILTFIFLAFLVLSFRTENSLLYREILEENYIHVYLAIAIYVVAGFWPLSASTVRRLHDLDIKGPRFIFLWRPTESLTIAKDLLHRRGTLGANRFGADPGIHE